MIETVMAESQFGEALSDKKADRTVALLESLTGSAPAVTVPILRPDTADTPRQTTDVMQ